MKAKILDHLQQADTPVSGERLSKRLGVSRVAVWKHMRQLQEVGYLIETTPKGYRLVQAPDAPFPWVMGDRGSLVHYHLELPSTMDAAMTLARKGCLAFTTVVAERQTKGRGRLQRRWQSTPGGLYFTMVLRPRIALAEAPLINLAAAVDLADTLHDLYAVDVQLKWPNDLLVEGRKLSGILSQMAAEPDRIDFINLGIGINVHNDTRGVKPPAVAVAALTDRSVSRARILEGFWERLALRLAGDRLAGVVDQWKPRAVTLGRMVTVQTLTDKVSGRALGVAPDGALVVETETGQHVNVLYGDCFHGE